jgi:hypothetical protein
MDWLPIAFVAGGGTVLALIAALIFAVRRADKRLADRAVELLQQNSDPPQVLTQLTAEGVDQKQATSVLRRVVRRLSHEAIIASVNEMLDKGIPESEVREQVTAKGLKAETAANLVEELAHPRWLRRHPVASVANRVPVMLAGCAVLIASLIVRDGNLTGKWVTFPYAGLLTKLVGVLILAMGGGLTILPFMKPDFIALEDD